MPSRALSLISPATAAVDGQHPACWMQPHCWPRHLRCQLGQVEQRKGETGGREAGWEAVAEMRG